jgi:hypothetical protein
MAREVLALSLIAVKKKGESKTGQSMLATAIASGG